MNKVNILKVSSMIIMIFIVLLAPQVFATSGTTPISGDGSETNPYIIQGQTCVVEYQTLPFYFAVDNSGTYEIDYDDEGKKVHFTYAGNTNNAVILDETTFSTVQNYQLGVKPALDINNAMVTPEYNIREISSFYMDRAGSARELGFAVAGISTRDIPIYNATIGVSTAINGAKSNVYYFAKHYWEGSEAFKLFQPLGFKKNADMSGGNPNWDYIEYDYLSNEEEEYVAMFIPSANTPVEEYGGGKAAMVKYTFNGNTNTALNDDGASGTIEEMLVRMFMAIGDTILLGGFQSFLGQDLTIDSLIFNTYPNTSIDFYNSDGTGITGILVNVINTWFNIFSNITYVAYVIILVYIGIIVMLSAASEREAKANSYITSWISGLLILLVVPRYGVPMIMNLNNALVSTMGGDAQEFQTYYNIYSKFEAIGKSDILGSDSTTISIEGLQKEYDEITESLKEKQADLIKNSEKSMIAEHKYHPLFGYCNAGSKICTRNLSAREKSLVKAISKYAYSRMFRALDDLKKER